MRHVFGTRGGNGMRAEVKKEAPQINPQDKNKNIYKNIITENCGFVKGLERTSYDTEK